MAWTEVPFTAGDLWDNGYDGTGTPRQSAYAFLRLTTTAVSLRITGTTTAYGASPSSSFLGVYVDNAWAGALQFTANGQQVFTVALDAGTKTVDVVTGEHFHPASDDLGTFLDLVEFDDTGGLTAAIVAPQDPSILLYGDSIISGAMTTGIHTRLRHTYGRNTAVEAYPGRRFRTDAATSELQTSFVAKLAALNPERIWFAIGINDWSGSSWDVADFGSAYAAVLDALHVALPSCTMYCQSPIYTLEDTANSRGDTVADYGAAVAAACVGRESYAVFVDGLSVISAGFIDTDGIHPATGGYVAYGDGIEFRLCPPLRELRSVVTSGSVGSYLRIAQPTWPIFDTGSMLLRVRAGVAPDEGVVRFFAMVNQTVDGTYFGLYQSTTTNRIYFRNNGRIAYASVTAGWSVNDWLTLIIGWEKGSDAMTININVSEKSVVKSGTWGSQVISSTMGFMANTTGSSAMPGWISRICFWNRLLTEAEKVALQSHLPVVVAPFGRVADWVPGISTAGLVDPDETITLLGSPPTAGGPPQMIPKRKALLGVGV